MQFYNVNARAMAQFFKRWVTLKFQNSEMHDPISRKPRHARRSSTKGYPLGHTANQNKPTATSYDDWP